MDPVRAIQRRQLVAAVALTAAAENPQQPQTQDPASRCQSGWSYKFKTSMKCMSLTVCSKHLHVIVGIKDK